MSLVYNRQLNFIDQFVFIPDWKSSLHEAGDEE